MNTSSSAFTVFIGPPGLQVVVLGGTVLCANVSTVLPTTIIALTASAVNFVYVKFVSASNPAAGGVVPTIAANADTTKAPDGIPLATVTTNSTGVTSIVDTRPDFIIGI